MPIPQSRAYMVGVTVATILVLAAASLMLLSTVGGPLAALLAALFLSVAALLGVGLARDLTRLRRPLRSGGRRADRAPGWTAVLVALLIISVPVLLLAATDPTRTAAASAAYLLAFLLLAAVVGLWADAYLRRGAA